MPESKFTTVILLIAVFGLGSAPVLVSAATPPWEIPVRVLAFEQTIVLLDDGGQVWRSDGAGWTQVELPGTDFIDIAPLGGSLALLHVNGKVYRSTLSGDLEEHFVAPSGAEGMAPAANGRFWFVTRTTPQAPIKVYLRGPDSESTRVEFSTDLTEAEEQSLARAYSGERITFNQVVLLGDDEQARLVFRRRDLMAECNSTACQLVRWTSPRSVAARREQAAPDQPPLPLATVWDAVQLDGGNVFVLPAVTDYDADTGQFDQRDFVLHLTSSGRLVKSHPLPGRALALVRRGGKVFALLESGRLDPIGEG